MVDVSHLCPLEGRSREEERKDTPGSVTMCGVCPVVLAPDMAPKGEHLVLARPSSRRPSTCEISCGEDAGMIDSMVSAKELVDSLIRGVFLQS